MSGYEATHKFSGGGSVSGPRHVIDAAVRAEQSMAAETRMWTGHLRALGVKLAHPEDGWVDRVRHAVQPCYPQFNYGPKVGDLIALGWPWEETRVVRVTDVVRLRGYIGPDSTEYLFDPEPVHTVPSYRGVQ